MPTGRDRRRYPRVPVTLDFRATAADTEWQGKTVDLSPYGVKVEPPGGSAALPVGARLELILTLPDEEPPLAVAARVVRTDDDGVALCFLQLGATAFARVKNLVDSLLHTLCNGSGGLHVEVRPLRERRRAPRAKVALDVDLDAVPFRLWQGKMINLSTIGASLAWPATADQPPWGAGVDLRLAHAKGQPPVSLKGVVWRRDRDSVAILFLELTQAQRNRLQDLVNALGDRSLAPVG